MAPRTWLKRLCSAGEDEEGQAELWIERSLCTARLPTSAASSGSARTKPCTGSRNESTRGVYGETVGTTASRSVLVGLAGEVPVGAQEVDDLAAAAEDGEQRQGALGDGLGQQVELAQHRQVELDGNAVDRSRAAASHVFEPRAQRELSERFQ